jgi:hypothetical protein
MASVAEESTPTLPPSQGGSAKKLKKPSNVHVHISEATPSPSHTYVEKLHSPAPTHLEPEKNFEDLAAVKHAHIDDDIPSPSGLVQRVQTPMSSKEDLTEFNEELSGSVVPPAGAAAAVASQAKSGTSSAPSGPTGSGHCPATCMLTLSIVASAAFGVGFLLGRTTRK